MGENDPTGDIAFIDNIQSGCNIYRGHLKLAILRCLQEDSMHGLEIINRIMEVTSGEWAPSPGSVYPLLKELESGREVTKVKDGRALIYSITDEGRRTLQDLSRGLRQQLNFVDWIISSQHNQ